MTEVVSLATDSGFTSENIEDFAFETDMDQNSNFPFFFFFEIEKKNLE